MSSDNPKASLANVATATLETVLNALLAYRTTTPLSRSSLAALGVKSQSDVLLTVFEGHSRHACITVLEASLAERAKYGRPAPELVWSGPEAHHATRNTATILRELFENARDRVVIVGYRFDDALGVLEALHASMRDHGVTAHVFVHVKSAEAKAANEEKYAHQQLDAFAQACWPFGNPRPSFHCGRRAMATGQGAVTGGLQGTWVAVDGARALVSSSEVSVLLNDPNFAGQLERQFHSLVDRNLVYTRP